MSGSLPCSTLTSLMAVGVLMTGRLARCLFYSEGARAGTEWFFEMKSGKPVFYLRDGRLHWMPRPKS